MTAQRPSSPFPSRIYFQGFGARALDWDLALGLSVRIVKLRLKSINFFYSSYSTFVARDLHISLTLKLKKKILCLIFFSC